MKLLYKRLKEHDTELYNKFMLHMTKVRIVSMTYSEDDKNILKGSYDSYGYGCNIVFEPIDPQDFDYITNITVYTIAANYMMHRSILLRSLINRNVPCPEAIGCLDALAMATVEILVTAYR